MYKLVFYIFKKLQSFPRKKTKSFIMPYHAENILYNSANNIPNSSLFMFFSLDMKKKSTWQRCNLEEFFLVVTVCKLCWNFNAYVGPFLKYSSISSCYWMQISMTSQLRIYFVTNSLMIEIRQNMTTIQFQYIQSTPEGWLTTVSSFSSTAVGVTDKNN